MSASGSWPLSITPRRRCCTPVGWLTPSPRIEEALTLPWSATSPPQDEFNSAALQRRLQTSQMKIYANLDRGISMPQITLPALNEESFEPVEVSGEGYTAVGAGSFDGSFDAAQCGLLKNSEFQAKAIQVQRKIHKDQVALDMVAHEGLAGVQKNEAFQLFAPLVCAIIAVLLAVAMAILRFGPPMAALFGAISSSMGVYMSWKSRAEDHFNLAHAVFDQNMSKLHDTLEIVDYDLLGTLEELRRDIEIMGREQRPRLESGKAMGEDVPNPLLLKEPLEGLDTELSDSILAAKWEVSRGMEDALNSSIMVRLPTSKRLWDMWMVTIPCDVMFLVNLLIGLTLASSLVPPQAPYDYWARHIRIFTKASNNATFAKTLNVTVDTAAQAASLMAAHPNISVEAALAESKNNVTNASLLDATLSAVPRMLKGGHGHGRHGPSSANKNQGPRTFHGVVLLGAPVVFTDVGSMPDWEVLFDYLFPVFLEIVLCAVQILIMMYITQKPRVIKFVNFSIAELQEAINRILNRVAGPVVDKANVQLRVVRWQADIFFNKMGELKS